MLATLITLISVVYQRVTGPTYPVKGSVEIEQSSIAFKLHRSHSGNQDHCVKIVASDSKIQGKLLWKRYPVAEEWKEVNMTREGDTLLGMLPNQPPAGKVEYRVVLSSCCQKVSLTGNNSVILRFKGDVPFLYLLPHIVLIFAGMLFSMRAGLEVLSRNQSNKMLSLYSLFFILVGGIAFGVIIQYYAFGAFWTGFPVGKDLTDTKTLVAFIFWVLAVVQTRKGKDARWWILAASIVTLVVYLIPHSVLGSELDYTAQQAIK